MLPVSADFLSTIRGSHERLLVGTIQTPAVSGGGLSAPLEFQISGGSVRAQYQNGQRYEATVTVTPDDTRRWSDVLLTPGSLFNLQVLVRTSGSAYEPVSLFTGELSSAPTVSFYGDGFDLTMQDQWVRLDRCRFVSPYTTPSGLRSAIMTDVVTGAIPYVNVIVSPAASATHAGGVITDKMRTDLLIDLANDSAPDYSVGFSAEGNFLIDTQPAIDVNDAVYQVTDGENGTLVDFQAVKEVDRMYNTVVVKPSSDTQAWTQVIVEISDPTHPRHKSKIGVVPYFQNAPTASTQAIARNIGTLTLQRIVQEQSSLRIVSVDNPALEPGDVITVAVSTGPNSGDIIPCMLTSITRDLASGTMELEAQQDIVVDVEEAI
jgi:hypothetical protein